MNEIQKLKDCPLCGGESMYEMTLTELIIFCRHCKLKKTYNATEETFPYYLSIGFSEWNKRPAQLTTREYDDLIEYCIKRVEFINSLVQQGVIPGQLDTIELHQSRGRIKELKDMIRTLTFLKHQYD